MTDHAPRVFISYSHESRTHGELVRKLAVSLARDGCLPLMDVEKNTPEDWPMWMEQQLLNADFVLCILTETYLRRFDYTESPDRGHGVGWEAGLIRRLLYLSKLQSDRVLLAFFGQADINLVPLSLVGCHSFVLTEPGYESLLRKLLSRPHYAPFPVGSPPDLPSRQAEPMFPRPGARKGSLQALPNAPKEAPTADTSPTVRETNPNDASELFTLANLQACEMKAHEQAIENYVCAGKKYAGSGLPLKAIASFKAACELIRKHVPQMAHQYVHISQQLAGMLEQVGMTGDAVAAWGEVASRYEQEGRDLDAISVFEKMVALDEGNPVPRLRLAEAWRRIRETDRAVDSYWTAVQLLRKMSRHDDALKVIDKILYFRREPRYAFAAADLYVRKGTREAGREALDRLAICYRANPEDLDMLALTAHAFTICEENERALDCRVQMARLARERGNEDVFQRIMEHLKQEAPNDERVVALDTPVAAANTNRQAISALREGVAYRAAGCDAEAMAMFRQALNLCPRSPALRRRLTSLVGQSDLGRLLGEATERHLTRGEPTLESVIVRAADYETETVPEVAAAAESIEDTYPFPVARSLRLRRTESPESALSELPQVLKWTLHYLVVLLLASLNRSPTTRNAQAWLPRFTRGSIGVNGWFEFFQALIGDCEQSDSLLGSDVRTVWSKVSDRMGKLNDSLSWQIRRGPSPSREVAQSYRRELIASLSELDELLGHHVLMVPKDTRNTDAWFVHRCLVFRGCSDVAPMQDIPCSGLVHIGHVLLKRADDELLDLYPFVLHGSADSLGATNSRDTGPRRAELLFLESVEGKPGGLVPVYSSVDGTEVAVPSLAFDCCSALQEPHDADDSEKVKVLGGYREVRRLPEGTLVGGRWEITDHLRSGGYADVYSAHHRGRRAAIKILKQHLCGDLRTVSRFQSEARQMQEMQHPSICKVFESRRDPRVGHYMALELATGWLMPSRRVALDASELDKPASLQLVLRLAISLVAALSAIHRAGIVHRDVKPNNILLFDGDVAKIADFGIARHKAGPRVTTQGGFVGTMDYTAPAPARGEEATQADDIYSVGIVLYELLEGRFPWGGSTEFDRLLKRAEFPSPTFSDRIPLSLRALIAECLLRDRNERPAASDLGIRLSELQRGISPQSWIPWPSCSARKPRR